jgi:hypothetical protein
MRLTLSERNVLWLQRAVACGPVGSDLFHPSLTHHFGLDSQRQTWSVLTLQLKSLLLSSTTVDCSRRAAMYESRSSGWGFESFRAHQYSEQTCTNVGSGPFLASWFQLTSLPLKFLDAALASRVLTGAKMNNDSAGASLLEQGSNPRVPTDAVVAIEIMRGGFAAPPVLRPGLCDPDGSTRRMRCELC